MPLDSDTDDDGMSDGDEVANGFDPLSNQDAQIDSDNDGLTNAQEFAFRTDPNNADTDDDGLSDSEEVLTYQTNPLKSDSDNDGLSDIDELTLHNTNPNNSDSDSDLMPDKWEIDSKLNPNLNDSNDDNDTDDRDNVTEFTDQTNPLFAEVIDRENNGSFDDAQPLNDYFNLTYSIDIGDSFANTSQTLPHVTILGKGQSENDFDFYKFTVSKSNSKLIVDIDHSEGDGEHLYSYFDSYIEIYNANGVLITNNDDANLIFDGQQGSALLVDSYTEMTIEQPGTYYIKVMGYGYDYVPQNNAYTLNVSLENAKAPSDSENQ